MIKKPLNYQPHAFNNNMWFISATHDELHVISFYSAHHNETSHHVTDRGEQRAREDNIKKSIRYIQHCNIILSLLRILEDTEITSADYSNMRHGVAH